MNKIGQMFFKVKDVIEFIITIHQKFIDRFSDSIQHSFKKLPFVEFLFSFKEAIHNDL